MSDQERWIEISGYEDLYAISDYGRVMSIRKTGNKILKPSLDDKGYLAVTLSKNGKPKRFTVHRLVAFHFINNPEFKKTVNHIDGIKTNNNHRNLEWATHSENVKHAYDNGLAVAKSANVYGNFQGEKHHSAKLTEDQVIFILENVRKNGGTMSERKLAKQFGVACSTISAIVSGKKWRHIPRTRRALESK